VYPIAGLGGSPSSGALAAHSLGATYAYGESPGYGENAGYEEEASYGGMQGTGKMLAMGQPQAIGGLKSMGGTQAMGRTQVTGTRPACFGKLQGCLRRCPYSAHRMPAPFKRTLTSEQGGPGAWPRGRAQGGGGEGGTTRGCEPGNTKGRGVFPCACRRQGQRFPGISRVGVRGCPGLRRWGGPTLGSTRGRGRVCQGHRCKAWGHHSHETTRGKGRRMPGALLQEQGRAYPRDYSGEREGMPGVPEQGSPFPGALPADGGRVPPHQVGYGEREKEMGWAWERERERERGMEGGALPKAFQQKAGPGYTQSARLSRRDMPAWGDNGTSTGGMGRGMGEGREGGRGGGRGGAMGGGMGGDMRGE